MVGIVLACGFGNSVGYAHDRRDDVVDLAIIELNRLLDEQMKGHRTLMVDGELHDAVN